MLVKPLNRDAKTALDRYVALTGDVQASRQDPAVRRFFDGFESLGERESAQAARPGISEALRAPRR